MLIEVKACGICGTDIHVWHDQFPYWPPVILGHEFSGEIVAAGPETESVQDRGAGGGRASHSRLRALLFVPYGEYSDLPAQAFARLGHRRRFRKYLQDAGTPFAPHS